MQNKHKPSGNGGLVLRHWESFKIVVLFDFKIVIRIDLHVVGGLHGDMRIGGRRGAGQVFRCTDAVINIRLGGIALFAQAFVDAIGNQRIKNRKNRNFCCGSRGLLRTV